MNTDKRNLYIPQEENEIKRVYEIVKGILLSKCVEIFSSFEDDRNQGIFRLLHRMNQQLSFLFLKEQQN